MSFPYTNNVPNPPNDPSVDAPKMQVNTATVDSWTQIDHVGFNNANGGKHQKVTFVDVLVAPAPPTPTDPQSILYTTEGTASDFADLTFQNQNGIFPVSKLRAIGVFTGSAANPSLPFSGFNISNISAVTAVQYVITLTPNTTTGSTVIVFISAESLTSNAPGFTWSFAGNALTINFLQAVAAKKISFSIYQM